MLHCRAPKFSAHLRIGLRSKTCNGSATSYRSRALEQQMHVIFVNGVGEMEVRGRRWSLYGTSTIVSATGQKIARAGAGEEMLTGFLPASALADAANVFPVMRDRRPDAYGALVAPRSSMARVRRGPLA